MSAISCCDEDTAEVGVESGWIADNVELVVSGGGTRWSGMLSTGLVYSCEGWSDGDVEVVKH
jgi:hypothetical protein